MRALHALYKPVLRWSLSRPRRHGRDRRCVLPGRDRPARCRGSAASSCRRWRKAISGSARRCRRPSRSRRACRYVARCGEILLQASRSDHGGVAARPPRQRQRRLRLLQRRVVRAAQAVRRMAAGHDQGQARPTQLQTEFDDEFAGRRRSTSRNTFRTTSRRPVGRQGRQLGQDHRPRPRTTSSSSADQVMKEMQQVEGVADLGIFPRARPAQSQHQGRSRKGGALRPQHRRRQQRRAGGARRRRGDHACSRATASSTSPCGSRRNYRDSIDVVAQHQGRLPDADRRNAYIPLRELADITLDTGASYIYHERNAALHPDQIQRARPRSRQHGRRGAGAHRQEREAADRLPHRLGRRVRGPAAGQEAARRSSCRSASC